MHDINIYDSFYYKKEDKEGEMYEEEGKLSTGMFHSERALVTISFPSDMQRGQ
jgi:hypothetical protein